MTFSPLHGHAARPKQKNLEPLARVSFTPRKQMWASLNLFFVKTHTIIQSFDKYFAFHQSRDGAICRVSTAMPRFTTRWGGGGGVMKTNEKKEATKKRRWLFLLLWTRRATVNKIKWSRFKSFTPRQKKKNVFYHSSHCLWKRILLILQSKRKKKWSSLNLSFMKKHTVTK